MQTNLNLGIGYAIPTAQIKNLHAVLNTLIPKLNDCCIESRYLSNSA